MSSFKYTILCLGLIFTFLTSSAQQKKIPVNDFTAILHEETLNKVFVAIDTIRGTNEYEIMLIKGKYHWTVINPRIEVRKDSSRFYCDARVEVGPFSYMTKVPGIVKITYDEKKNEIQVKITKAIFEIYTFIFNKKVHIKDVNIADYLTEPFIFEGPKTMATDFEFMMPDSTMKHIYIQPSTCEMEVRYREIVTRCEVMVSDKPFKPAPPVSPKPTTPPPATNPKPTTAPATNGTKK